MVKYSTAWQATDDNMVHVHCLLDTKDYRHTLRICNTMIFHCSNGCTNEPHCYVIRAMPVVLKFSLLAAMRNAISDEANSGVQGTDSIRLGYKEFNRET